MFISNGFKQAAHKKRERETSKKRVELCKMVSGVTSNFLLGKRVFKLVIARYIPKMPSRKRLLQNKTPANTERKFPNSISASIGISRQIKTISPEKKICRLPFIRIAGFSIVILPKTPGYCRALKREYPYLYLLSNVRVKLLYVTNFSSYAIKASFKILIAVCLSKIFSTTTVLFSNFL